MSAQTKTPAPVKLFPLGFQWPTPDPFLFCVHHHDAYPAGNDQLGPAASLAGRDIGQDFTGPVTDKAGWRMYHGDVVPGFPQHPHRGFETVTIVRTGLIDHSDSLGATARFGDGDVQWLTTGKGISHSEMFPLLDKKGPNPAELFPDLAQLAGRRQAGAAALFHVVARDHSGALFVDEAGKKTTVTIVAGALDGTPPPAPPPHSWASRASSELAIWTIAMEPGARWTLPGASAGLSRALYFFVGDKLQLDGQELSSRTGALLPSDHAVDLVATSRTELLLLQARPIAEPVAQHGPFVMNTRAEIQQAFSDYGKTRFGGWPWQSDGPVHPREADRFAMRDGAVEKPPKEAA